MTACATAAVAIYLYETFVFEARGDKKTKPFVYEYLSITASSIVINILVGVSGFILNVTKNMCCILGIIALLGIGFTIRLWISYKNREKALCKLAKEPDA